MVESGINNKLAGTYRKLFDTIERGVDQCSTDRLQTILEEKRSQFKLGLDIFTASSNQSRSKITTSLTVNGKSISFNSKEKDVFLRVSDITNLNEVQCVSLWDAYRQENKTELSPVKSEVPQNENTELIMDVVRFYYEDRISFLNCISSLQRISLLKEHPFNKIANDIVQGLFEDSTNNTPFINRLFSQFATLVRSQVPTRHCTYAGWTSDWAKQNLKEQKALLEILFLFSITTTYPPNFVLTIIQEFEVNNFGTFQVFSYVLDKEGEKIREQVTNLCHLITVSVIIAPYLTLNIQLDPSGLDAALIDTPLVIAKINQIVLHMGDDQEHSVLLLAWSYFLSCLRAAVDSATELTDYDQIKLLLKGQQLITSDVLADRSFAYTAGLDVSERKQCIEQTDHLERTLIGRSLKLGVFDTIQNLIESEICDEDDVNNAGYRAVLRLLLKSFLSTTLPQFLPTESYDGLIQSFCAIYRDQSELCSTFWEEDAKEDYPLIQTALGRFPVQFTQLTELLSSLASTDEANKDKSPADRVYDYLCKLPTITVILKDYLFTTATVENNVPVAHADKNMRITPTLDYLAGIQVFKQTRGIFLSSTEDNRIVKFAESYSGWHMLVSVLANSMKNHETTDLDVKDDDVTLKGGNPEAIISILNLIYRVLVNSPNLVPLLVNHVQAASVASRTVYDTPILVSVLCDVLTFSSSVKPCPIPIATAAIKCLHVLLPHYSKPIWTYLHVSPIVPRAGSNKSLLPLGHVSQIQQIVANFECTMGSYSLLLSFLDLVQGLVHDIQSNWREREADAEDMSPEVQAQTNTLYTCLHYLMLEVFPSYSDWRYKKLSERYLIGTKLVSIFIEICNCFKERPVKTQPSLSAIRDGVYNNFLYNGSPYHVSPLLDIISEGADIANALYKSSHIKEAQLVEESTALTLVFVKLLLQRRLEDIQNQTTHSENRLERLMLEQPVQKGCSDFLLRIAQYIDYRHNIVLPIQATHVLSLLCQTTHAWETVPDFMQHLGNIDQVRVVIQTFLETAKDDSQSEFLLSAIWRLITILLETQPGLAVLFLDCGDFIMPSPKSAVRLESQTNADSAIRAAVDILQSWEQLSVQKPVVVSNVLRFLSVFWKTAFDHYGLVERTRSDSVLWDVLGKIMLNPTLEANRSNHVLQDVNLLEVDFGQEDRFDLSTRQLCCANLSKAFAMSIMSYELHMTAGSERAKGSLGTAEALPVGLKNLLVKMGDPVRLSQLRTESVKNDFNPQLFKAAKEASRLLLQTIGINDPFALLFEAPISGSGDDGASGEVRHYGDSYLYNLRMTVNRVFSFYNEIRTKYNLSQRENLLVTPEINAALNVERFCNDLIKCVIEANHNYSIVDSQIILLKSFNIFVETCSQHVHSLIWAAKGTTDSSDNLCNFICDLVDQAKKENRNDGVTLTSYSALVHLIRSLIEDWINQSKATLLNSNSAVKEEYITRVSKILLALSGLLDRENFTMMQSVLDITAISFHQPLLESVWLCVHALRGPIQSIQGKFKMNIQTCLKSILPTLCLCFQVLAFKAQSLGAQTNMVSEEDMDNCIKDVTAVSSLLQEIIRNEYGLAQDEWILEFSKHNTFNSLLKLFYGGIDLLTKEIDRQTANADRLYSLNITPFAETTLYFLLTLSNIPKAAKLLVENHFFDALTNNSLTGCLQQGTLDLFIRFGDKTKKELGYVERNPLHSVWCQMLSVIGSLLRTVGDSNEVLRSTITLLQICGPQIGKTYEKANSRSESLFALIPLECLSLPMLEELENINIVFFELSKHLERIPKLATDLLTSYKDCSLLLLQRYLYFLTHPSHMKAQLYRTNPTESADEFMNKVKHSILTVTHMMISTLIVLTHADFVFTAPDVEWHFGNTIFYPDMRDSTDTMVSFGTLVEYINTSILMVSQWESGKPQPSEAMDVIQSCSLILTSQIALWVAKPGLSHSERMGITIDNVMDIAEVLSKAAFTLEKLVEKNMEDDIKSRIKLINMLLSFLEKRFFENF
ncbi:hypothetical protein G6F56_000814 [Rhizopus delemar]|nr:hypothetical protein G6F56_000814 [Rhizopus delemar]